MADTGEVLVLTVPKQTILYMVVVTDSIFEKEQVHGIYSTKERAEYEAKGTSAWGSDGRIVEYLLDGPFPGEIRRCENCRQIISPRLIYCGNTCAIADA